MTGWQRRCMGQGGMVNWEDGVRSGHRVDHAGRAGRGTSRSLQEGWQGTGVVIGRFSPTASMELDPSTEK